MTNNSNVAALRRAPYRLKQAMCLMTIAVHCRSFSDKLYNTDTGHESDYGGGCREQRRSAL